MLLCDSTQDSGRHVMDDLGIIEWWGQWPTRSAKAPEKVGLAEVPFQFQRACDGGPVRVGT